MRDEEEEAAGSSSGVRRSSSEAGSARAGSVEFFFFFFERERKTNEQSISGGFLASILLRCLYSQSNSHSTISPGQAIVPVTEAVAAASARSAVAAKTTTKKAKRVSERSIAIRRRGVPPVVPRADRGIWGALRV